MKPGHFPKGASAQGPGVCESVRDRFQIHFSVCRSFAGLMGASPTGLQSQVFGGFVSQVPVLNIGVSGVGHKPLLREKLWVLSSLLILGQCTGMRGRDYGEIVFQQFLSASVPFSSPLPNVMGSLPVLVFFRGNYSIYICSFSVSMGGGEFRIFLHCHPEPELPCNIIEIYFKMRF